jgi:hypothetical protein
MEIFLARFSGRMPYTLPAAAPAAAAAAAAHVVAAPTFISDAKHELRQMAVIMTHHKQPS